MRKTIDIENYRFDINFIEKINDLINSKKISRIIKLKKHEIYFTPVRIWGNYGIELRINAKPYEFFQTGNFNAFEKSITLSNYFNKKLN